MGPGKRCITAWVSVAAITAGGCRPSVPTPHDHGGNLVDEYRPAGRPIERPAYATAVYALWEWEPLPPPPTVPPAELLRPASRPASPPAGRRWRERAVEVGRATVLVGEPVGFRRRPDGQLIAVAGPTTRPLPAGHYCWHLLPGNPTFAAGRGSRTGGPVDGRVLGVGLIVVFAVVGLIALPFAIDHYDHHAHLVRTVGRAIDSSDP